MHNAAVSWYNTGATELSGFRVLYAKPIHNLPDVASKEPLRLSRYSVARVIRQARRLFVFTRCIMSEGFGSGSLAAFLMMLHEDGEANRLPETITDRWAGTLDYHGYIQSPEWKEKAEAAKKRAGYRCQICNRRGKLEAHHRTYERLGQELPEDITVLCDRCHGLYSGEMEPEPCSTSTPF